MVYAPKREIMKDIEDLRAELFKIGERVGGGVRPNHYFFIPDKPDGMGTPYLELHGKEYHFIVNERGAEMARKITLSDDEILYWFVECGVAGLASEFAAINSSPEKNFWDVYFRKQYNLMLSIKPEWATRKHKEFTEILNGQI